MIETFQPSMDKYKVKIFIFVDPREDLEQNLHLYSSQNIGKTKKVKKYYVQDQGKDFFYAESGNSKVQNAISKG